MAGEYMQAKNDGGQPESNPIMNHLKFALAGEFHKRMKKAQEELIEERRQILERRELEEKRAQLSVN